MYQEMYTWNLYDPINQCHFNKFIYFKDFIYRERGREREREEEKHQCVGAFHAPPTGDLAHNPSMFPDQESNLWPFDLQAGTESTEPHQPDLNKFI